MRLLWSVIMLSAMSSEVFAGPKETRPQGPPPKPFHLPATTDFTLPNGMQVTIVPYGIVPKVAVRAFVGAGAIDDSATQVWLSKLNAALMKEGTRTRSAEQVAREAADMGGQLEINSGSDTTSVGGVVLSDFGPKFVALLADVLTAPALPASELPRLKADFLRDLSIDKSQPGSLAQERFLKTLFPDHPYGRTYPSESELKSYTIEDVQTFYRNNFDAARTHLYIAGKLEGDLRRAVEDAFGAWPKGTPAPDLPAHPVSARSLQFIDRPGAAQSNLLVGLPVAAPSSPDYIKLDVTTAVTGPSLKEIFYEVDRLRKDPPSAEELKGIQNYLAGLFILRNTISPDAIIGQLHFVDAQGLDRSYLSAYVQKVMEVTPADVQGMAETYLVPSKMTIVVVGDKAKIADQIAPYEATTQ